MFEKLMFWKKKDDFSELDKDFGLGNEMSLGPDLNSTQPASFGQDNFGLEAGHADNIQPFNAPMARPQTYPQQPMVQQQPFQMQQAPQYPPTQQDSIVGKNIEIISYKLDAIKSSIDSINQRIANLEKIAYQTESFDQPGRRGW